jgi:DNA polymerase-1
MPKASKTKGTIFALDVSFFTFRAYYALPPLSTSAGLPTNAIHGVASMLERLIKNEKPDYVVAAFDSKGDTFRNEIYPDYKANRDEPDEELALQFPYVRRLIEAMSIHCLQLPGFEADDVLATVARVAEEDGFDTVMVTGDKDLMQCVGPRVTLYDPMKGARVGAEQVVEKFGVPPEGVVEVQGLMGDSTDNIPGIKGVGPKTATALIQHFGSIDEMLKRTEEIESLGIRGAAGVRKKVEAGAEDALLSRKLATVDAHVALDVDVDAMRFQSIHTREFLALAEELEMERLAGRLRDLVGDDDPAADSHATAGDDPESKVEPASPAKSKEAAGGRPKPSGDWKPLAGLEVPFALGADGDDGPVLLMRGQALDVCLAGREAISEALAELAAAGTSFSGHDLKGLCRRFGVPPGPSGIDLGLASYLYDSSAGDHRPADVVQRFLGEAAAEAGETVETLQVALDQVVRLVPLLREALDEHDQTSLYYDLEHPLLGCLARIEAKGIAVDVGVLESMSAEFAERMEGLVSKIYQAAGQEFNILSPLQLREILFAKLELPTKGVKKTKTGPSTDSDTLQMLSELHPLPALVLEYRGLAKLKSTYLDALPKAVDAEGRIHTSLNQTVTATGRLSSNHPNLQNIPIRTDDGRKIRRAFVAGRGRVLVSADYNQIELRVLADLTRDENLIRAFEAEKDIHSVTAAEVFEVSGEKVTADMRRAAKVINYGILYGMGPVRMSRELGIPRSKASEYIETYFARYPGVRRFYAETLEDAREQGYVFTRLGRRRYLHDIDSDHGGRRQAAERVATNTPIQGSAADIIKVAMLRLAEALDKADCGAEMVLQIHDELLVECPKRELKQGRLGRSGRRRHRFG